MPSLCCAIFTLQSCRLKLISKSPATELIYQLRSLLILAHDLRTLHLELLPPCLYRTRFNLSAIFEDVRFLELQDLKLEMGLITQQYLQQLFAGNYPKLLSLVMVELQLDLGSWQDHLSALRRRLSNCTILVEGLNEGNGWDIVTSIPFGEGLVLT